jgi:hypothetical protein
VTDPHFRDILFQLVTVYYKHIITVHLFFNILLQNLFGPKDETINTGVSASELKLSSYSFPTNLSCTFILIILLKTWIQYLHTSIHIYSYICNYNKWCANMIYFLAIFTVLQYIKGFRKFYQIGVKCTNEITEGTATLT